VQIKQLGSETGHPSRGCSGRYRCCAGRRALGA
jgi:hypothetical protein